MLTNKLTGASAADKTYIEDVFSTYLYKGTGATAQTINNGLDLAGKGGLVWARDRSVAANNCLIDTARGSNKILFSNLTNAESTSTAYISSFGSTGFTLGNSTINANGDSIASWTFRKAPKFFDVVTYTGTGSARTISHSLGAVPGMIIVKCTSTTSNWAVYHRSQTSASYYTKLNLTDVEASGTTVWNVTAPTSSVFSVGTSALTNTNGATYVAYLFAHDTTADGLIQCGSFTTDVNGDATINLGWEPQYVLAKSSSTTGDWIVSDNMRGMNQTNTQRLYANLSSAESATGIQFTVPTATGFRIANYSNNTTHVYMAIRRGPMRTPTNGTKVFAPVARTGTGANATVLSGFVTDAVIQGNRASAAAGTKFGAWDRLRGTGYLITNTVDAENAGETTLVQENPWDVMDGFKVGTTSTLTNASSNTFINWMLQRAPGFFDVVCYTGTGVARTVNHNLRVAPELMIVKNRSVVLDWAVYSKDLGTLDIYLVLNQNSGTQTSSTFFNATAPTASVFSVGTALETNQSSSDYVAYLFASCPGVSKVGSYTGNGSSQTINCGFSAGARFVLIKQTNSTGDWYVWDTARGIVAATDPHLSLNKTAAEVTTDDTIDPNSTGFIVNQVTATNVNVNAATYIYLAIA